MRLERDGQPAALMVDTASRLKLIIKAKGSSLAGAPALLNEQFTTTVTLHFLNEKKDNYPP